MHSELEIEFHDDLAPFEPRQTRRGQCKYPFASLEEPGKGFTIKNRAESTVRQALKRWMEQNDITGAAYSVKEVRENGAAGVRVRRDR